MRLNYDRSTLAVQFIFYCFEDCIRVFVRVSVFYAYFPYGYRKHCGASRGKSKTFFFLSYKILTLKLKLKIYESRKNSFCLSNGNYKSRTVPRLIYTLSVWHSKVQVAQRDSNSSWKCGPSRLLVNQTISLDLYPFLSLGELSYCTGRGEFFSKLNVSQA